MNDEPERTDLPPASRGLAGLAPAADPRLWETLSRWRAEQRNFALLTVTGTRGFTPRKAGAHMLVDDGGETFGTIGGGAIENDALREARALLESGGGSFLLERHLTQELGMCCGGAMSVFIEAVTPSPRLFVFGAGYIAQPLAMMAAACGFRVTVVDDRPEWTRPERFPGVAVECRSPETQARETRFGPDDFAVVVTHDHQLDQRVVQELLKQPLRFLGMIGSVAKQRKFALRLRARGFSDPDLARLHTPLGLAIGAATPEEIAVSVMAQLIQVRRGGRVDAGWVPRASRVTVPGAGDRPATETPSEEEMRR